MTNKRTDNEARSWKGGSRHSAATDADTCAGTEVTKGPAGPYILTACVGNERMAGSTIRCSGPGPDKDSDSTLPVVWTSAFGVTDAGSSEGGKGAAKAIVMKVVTGDESTNESELVFASGMALDPRKTSAPALTRAEGAKAVRTGLAEAGAGAWG